jgi:hypothetical protein
MGRKVIELLVSDLSGDELEAGQGQTVEFSYKGTSYSIDLTDKEAAGFDKAIAMYIEHATKSGGRRATGTRKPSGSGRSKEELAEIREWLTANGHDVSPRGRIKAELLEAYDAAH